MTMRWGKNDMTQKNEVMQNIDKKWLLITAACSVFAILVPHWISPGYYFDDDVRHCYMPQIYEIGTHLSRGELSFLSLRSAYAGNFLGEGQLALFNPVSLVLYLSMAHVNDLGVAALIYAGTYLLLMALGVYLLALRLRISPGYACVAGITVITAPMMGYWYASSWWNALSTNAWLPWAMLAFIATLENTKYLFLAVAAATAVLIGGWPHGSIALLVFSIVAAWCYEGERRRSFAVLLIWGGVALVLSLPTLFPLLVHVKEGVRSQWSSGNSGLMVSTIDELLSFSLPSYLSAVPHFFGGNQARQPNYYVAWYLLPMMIIFSEEILQCWKKSDFSTKICGYLMAIFFLLSLGPEQIGPLRWPFRFAPYFHWFLILFLFSVVAQVESWKKTKLSTVFMILSIGCVLCTQQTPELFYIHLLFYFFSVCGAYLLINLSIDRDRPALLLISALLIFSVIHLAWPNNGNVGHWNSPLVASSVDRRLTAENTLIVQSRSKEDRVWSKLPSGNMVLWERGQFINGYSPIEPKGLTTLLCFNQWSWVCRFPEKIFLRDEHTGVDWGSLFNLAEIRVEKRPDFFSKMQSLAPQAGFSLALEDDDYAVWHRTLKAYPGMVSWFSEGISAKQISLVTSEHERLLVTNTSDKPQQIIWARMPYAGYEITLDGRPLKVASYAETLLTTFIPPYVASGILELKYFPPGFHWTVPLAVVALIFSLGISLFSLKNQAAKNLN
jgi:hypothetical protein